MPRLPDNLVKPPVFDNPLRRTAHAPKPAPDAAPIDEGEDAGGVVISIATGAGVNADDPALPMPHRITVRIDDDTRRALETECYQRRVSGEKTNIAEIARDVLKTWAKRVGRRHGAAPGTTPSSSTDA